MPIEISVRQLSTISKTLFGVMLRKFNQDINEFTFATLIARISRACPFQGNIKNTVVRNCLFSREHVRLVCDKQYEHLLRKGKYHLYCSRLKNKSKKCFKLIISLTLTFSYAKVFRIFRKTLCSSYCSIAKK